MRTGIVESVHELRSITVGTMSGKPTRERRSRRRSRDAFGPKTTFGRWRRGVWSIADAARLPWKVWPTTTVSIAPLASWEMSARKALQLGRAEEIRDLLGGLPRSRLPGAK